MLCGQMPKYPRIICKMTRVDVIFLSSGSKSRIALEGFDIILLAIIVNNEGLGLSKKFEVIARRND